MLGSTSWIYSISGLRTRTMDSFSSSSSFRMDRSNSCPCISEPWTVPFPGVVSEQWTALFLAAVFQNHGQFMSCPLYFRTMDSSSPCRWFQFQHHGQLLLLSNIPVSISMRSSMFCQWFWHQDLAGLWQLGGSLTRVCRSFSQFGFYCRINANKTAERCLNG